MQSARKSFKVFVFICKVLSFKRILKFQLKSPLKRIVRLGELNSRYREVKAFPVMVPFEQLLIDDSHYVPTMQEFSI